MKRIEPPIGQKFGRLTVTGMHKGSSWACKCECGSEVNVNSYHLRTGHTKSCGCYKVESTVARLTKHGHRKKNNGGPTPEYSAWLGARARCSNANDPAYRHYGGRGIYVCDRWLISFENFFADMGERPTHRHSLDRIDVNKGYEPSNCRWATPEVQANNTRAKRIENFSDEVIHEEHNKRFSEPEKNIWDIPWSAA